MATAGLWPPTRTTVRPPRRISARRLRLGGRWARGLIIEEALHGLAAVAAMDGDAERAVRLWAAGEGLREATAVPLSEPLQFIAERYMRRAETQLSDEARTGAQAQGNSMTMEEAIEDALAVPDQPGSPPD